MSNAGYRLKPQTRDTAPTVLVTVGVGVSRADFTDGAGQRPHVVDDVHIQVCRRSRGRWGKLKGFHRLTVAGAWDVLDSLGGAGRRPYVVAPRASDTLTLLRWWERVERGECRIRPRKGEEYETCPRTGKRRKVRSHPLVIHGSPDIVGYTVGRNPFRWVSVTNWADLSLAEMAKQVGYPIPEAANQLDKWEAPSWPAEDQAYLIMKYMRSLCDWWLEVGGGSWKDTPGAASWSTFLRRGGENGIIRHVEEQTLKLEDRAVFGGRAAVWWYGDIGNAAKWKEVHGAPFPSGRGIARRGPVHRYDVRAMYPSLLGAERFPIRLIRHEGRINVQRLKALAETMCVVASVGVETQRAELPFRGKAGVEYPTGQFSTVLTTPEVLDAIRHKEIRHVWECAVYQPGAPFAEWSEWILALREGMRAKGDRPGELLVKTLANSFGGRLGRKKQGWTDAPHVVPRSLWGEWYVMNDETGNLDMFRSLAGMTQEMTREDFRPGTLGACFAHLTAYGRVMMSSLRSKLGKGQCLWQDTDGVILTDWGREALEKLPEHHPTRYGAIRFERTFQTGRFLTPKHYWLDGRWVLAGIHDGFEVDDGMTSSEVLTINPVRQAVRPDNAGIYQMVRNIDLSAIDPGVEVGADGWAVAPKRWAGWEGRKRSDPRTPALPVDG